MYKHHIVIIENGVNNMGTYIYIGYQVKAIIIKSLFSRNA